MILDSAKIRPLAPASARHGAAQLLAVTVCTTVLLLFAALTYARITLPHYTAQYAQKDTQQVVNLIITVLATFIGILISHCRRLTNEAETKSELHKSKLDIPRLHVHVEAAGGSHAAMGFAAMQNRHVWRLVVFYMFVITICGFLNSVLSVIFVIEPIISDEGRQSPAYVPIGVDIPWMWEGTVVDPCSTSIAEPGCTYNLAMTSLTSEMITYTPYTVGGVTFEPPNGTMGLPYWAMDHFSRQIRASHFEEERRQYCLPVMDPQIISCTELEFDQQLGRTNGSWVKYDHLSLVQSETDETLSVADMYKIAIPSNSTAESVKYRLSDQGQGGMLVRMYPEVIYNNMTIITAFDSVDPINSGANSDGYASLLYYLMYGVFPDDSIKPKEGPFRFVAKCEFESIKYRDNYRSSWRKVDFVLRNGVSRVNVTDERCPNPRGNGTSGFADLYFALEGAADILASTDGYCKLFNRNEDHSHGTNIFRGMSRLDAIVNKMLHISATSWSQSIHKYAMMNQTVYDQPILMTDFPHLYVIRINWTPTTYIGLVLSVLITLSAYSLAARWIMATYHLGFDFETWNLLEPIDLMAYSLAAYKDLMHNLGSVEQRKNAMRGKTSSVLHERPYREGTQSLIGLVSTLESTTASISPDSPVSPMVEKRQDEAGPLATEQSTGAAHNDDIDPSLGIAGAMADSSDSTQDQKHPETSGDVRDGGRELDAAAGNVEGSSPAPSAADVKGSNMNNASRDNGSIG